MLFPIARVGAIIISLLQMKRMKMRPREAVTCPILPSESVSDLWFQICDPGDLTPKWYLNISRVPIWARLCKPG